MAADLFESYAVTLVAALILGTAAFGDLGLTFPLMVPAIGVVTAMIGVFAVAPRRADRSGMTAINRGFFLSAVISLALVAVAAFAFLPSTYAELDGVTDAAVRGHAGDPRVLAVVAVAVGIVLAALIQQLTGYFTEPGRRPVKDVGKSSLTGPATVILAGVSLGLESAVYTALLIGLAVYGAFLLGGASITLALFAVALAGTGLLTTVGVIVAMDTFGPVSDNAQGIARCPATCGRRRAGPHRPRRRRQHHQGDHQGHRHRYRGPRGVRALRLVPGRDRHRGRGRRRQGGRADPQHGHLAATTSMGLVLGARRRLPLLRPGHQRRVPVRGIRGVRGAPPVPGAPGDHGLQREAPVRARRRHLHQGRPARARHARSPRRAGADRGRLHLGVGALGAYLAGAIGTGLLMAVFLANSGGAWDNAKKRVEDGHHGGKGSEAHAATVIGDTVGDPFKDTAGRRSTRCSRS